MTKRIMISILIASLMTFGILVNAQEFQSGQSTVTYTVEGSFMVNIPESMTIGQAADIYAEELNVEPNKALYVRASGFDLEDGIFLRNVNDYDSFLVAYFTNDSGEKLTSGNNLVGVFSEPSTTIHITPHIQDYDSGTKAGDYTGTVYFDISCE